MFVNRELFERNKAFINRDPSYLQTPTFKTSDLNPGSGIYPTGAVSMGGRFVRIPESETIACDSIACKKKYRQKHAMARMLSKKKIQQLALIKNGKGVLSLVLKPLLEAGVSALAPHILSGVESAISWIGSKLTKKKKRKGKGLRKGRGLEDISLIRGEGAKIKAFLKKIKKFAKKGVPIVHKLVKSLVDNEDFWAKLIKNPDKRKFITSLMKSAVDSTETLADKIAESADNDEIEQPMAEKKVEKVLEKIEKEADIPDIKADVVPKASAAEGNGIKKLIVKRVGRPCGSGNKKKSL